MKLQNMTHGDYLSHAAYGASDIIKMARSMAYFRWRKENPEPKSRPLVIGSATHLLLQAEITKEPALEKTISIYKDGSSLTKGFKQFQADNPNQYCLDTEELALCVRMVHALTENSKVMDYLEHAVAEPTIMGKYPNTDVLCKCRPDYLHVAKGVSINIKTTTDASQGGFIYATKDYHYDFQSAFYIDLLSQELGKPFDEVHILVEKVDAGEPVPIKIFTFSEDSIGWARSQIHTIMEKIPECEKSGIWPMPVTETEEIDVPLFARTIVSV